MSNRDTCICGQPYNHHDVFKCMNGSIRNVPKEKKMSNEEFPMTRKIGLSIWDSNYTQVGLWVKASDVEALFQSAQVVYGVMALMSKSSWGTSLGDLDAHSALLVGVTSIKKQTKAEAALELVEKLAKDPAYYSSLGAAEAKRILEMKDEV